MVGGLTRSGLVVACLLLYLVNQKSVMVPLHQGWAAQQQEVLVQQQTVCRGLGREAVDWWVMLKHPAGYQYSYVDSGILGNSSTAACSAGSCWRHRLSMLNPNPVANTLAALVAAAQPLHSEQMATAQQPAYVMYNDADPAGIEHYSYAHAKGVAAFSNQDSSSGHVIGFWMVHSAPRFPLDPAVPGFEQLAKPQAVFGQHFSCFSFAGSAAINTVAELLLASGPYLYSSRLPPAVAAAFPAWQHLVAGANDTQQRSVNVSFMTAAQQRLLAFAKTKNLVEQLTDVIVGPGLGVNMFWETWRRGHDALPSNCSLAVTSVCNLNVQQVVFPGSPYRWRWQADHSKWGVSAGSSIGSTHGVVCLGDMNRATWQAHRGGGYVCMQHNGLWQAFSSILAAVEPCPLNSSVLAE